MTPDLILYNASVRTMDKFSPEAEAIAIADNRILALGKDPEILSLATGSTRTLDMGNRLVLPGFWDTHFHLFEWARNIHSLVLAKADSFSAMAEMISTRAAGLSPGEWILGQGFNESEWPEKRMPLRDDLDRLAPDHPVLIWRCDCHLAVANSAALALAGIHNNFPRPEGGVVELDDAGEPTGILKELAINIVSAAVPALSQETLLGNMAEAVARCHRLGLTAVHDIRLMGGEDGADALANWHRLHRAGRLKLRCQVALPGERTDQAIAMGLTSGFGDDILRIGCLKFFADGGMGARTAWMTEPYLDGGSGMPLTPLDEIEDKVRRADQAGLACMVHAIGDRACREIIDMFIRLERDHTSRCLIPHRMEHIQMIRSEDAARLSGLSNLALSCQANNLSLDISMIDDCVGDLGRYTYNFKRLMDTGLPFVFNSDAPVADPNPLAGIFSAVARQRMDRTPEGGWYPEQAVSVEDAVRAYTISPAVMSGMGDISGSVIPGKRADLVVLDRNIFDIPVAGIPDAGVDMTIFDGEIVYHEG
ncbi:MAG: amidohydrolase [Desulfobacterales bacterium]|nr:amidohydrolase [Desulfobacterales bacterium]